MYRLTEHKPERQGEGNGGEVLLGAHVLARSGGQGWGPDGRGP